MRAACVLAALTISATSEAADITYETRALTGTDGPLGPGLGAGVKFNALGTPVLNGVGQTAFRGDLTGTGVTISNDRGIWSGGGGSGLTLVARRGNQAPGTPAGVNFIPFFSTPVLNGAGQAAFRGSLTGTGVTGSNDSGIWSEGGGSGLALVAREGSQAPGTAAGVNFGDFSFTPLVLNGAGHTAFRGDLTGTGVTISNDRGIWSEGGGSGLALVARTGSQAPGTAVGVNFSGFGDPVLNGAGQTAFHGTLTGTGVTSSNDRGIWSEGGGSGLALVARTGSQAPGTADGVNFSSFGTPVFNGAGHTAFRGDLTGTGVTGLNDSGIWSEGGGSGLALVAREGSQAPGTADGVDFSHFGDPVLNGAGQAAFRGSLTGTGVTGSNDSGIWSEGGGSGLALVAREGSQAPGTATGVTFSSFDTPVLNGAGQTAFSASLTGAGVTSSYDFGIWATAPDGVLHLIAREGDRFDVDDDPLIVDRRMILFMSLITASGGEDGRHTSFNDTGQLAFWLRFTDGSEGIFVATIAAPFTVTITPATAPATGYDFSWYSRPGKVYDLISSTDPATPLAQWPVHTSYSDIPATGNTTTLTAVPVDGSQRFFAVVEKNAPRVD
jgi:hypothetical protein